MSKHLVRDLEELHRNLLSMCSMVEAMIHEAVDGLSAPNYERAQALAQRDNDIDRWDVRIEEDCLKLLALHQPVATDLRRIATVLKIIAELERVADLGVHIAERTCSLLPYPEITVPEKLKEMAHRAVDMLHRSINAYVALDSKLARDVCDTDDEVDRMNCEIIDELTDLMQASPHLIPPLMHLFSASRHIERVADHATNIAEDVVYLVEGEIIRHHLDFERENSLETDPQRTK